MKIIETIKRVIKKLMGVIKKSNIVRLTKAKIEIKDLNKKILGLEDEKRKIIDQLTKSKNEIREKYFEIKDLEILNKEYKKENEELRNKYENFL